MAKDRGIEFCAFSANFHQPYDRGMKSTLKSWTGLSLLAAVLLGMTGCFFREEPHHDRDRGHDDHVIIEHDRR